MKTVDFNHWSLSISALNFRAWRNSEIENSGSYQLYQKTESELKEDVTPHLRAAARSIEGEVEEKVVPRVFFDHSMEISYWEFLRKLHKVHDERNIT